MNSGKTVFKSSKRLPLSNQALRCGCKQTLIRMIYQKKVPPGPASTVEDSETLVFEKSKGDLPASKIQKDIFGATILPQNLSFENAKKLSENQIRLEDIPLIDDILVPETLKGTRENLSKARMENFGSKETSKPNIQKSSQTKAELFWVADPYDAIPGPKIFRTLMSFLKQVTRQVIIVSLFRFLKANAVAPFKVYGPIVKIPEILGGRIVLMSKPEHISAVFEQDNRHPITSVLDSIERSRNQRRHKTLQDFGYLPEEWNNIKKIVGEPSIKNSEKYFDGLEEAAGKFVRRIKAIRNSQNEVPDDFLFEINKWSLECLCLIIFEKSLGFLDYDSGICSSKNSQLLYSLTQATKKLCHLETGFQFWRFMNTTSLSSLGLACNVLETIISEYVSQVQMNLLRKKDNLMKSCADNSISVVESLLLREKATPDDVVTAISETLLIGINTMSAALGFLFYHLSANPHAQEEVWKEVKCILPEKYCRLEYEQLSSFKYIQACLKESLRLKMPMPVLSRILTQNITVSNYQLPKGTFVLMTAQVECMKEDNFDEPTEFCPERWLERDVSHPYTSLPLGSYFDDSLQRRLAELSVCMCASLVSRNFTIDYLHGDIEATSTVISFPNKPLKFTFTDRKI